VQGGDQEVPDLPPDAAWLVMTHDHALDLAIVEAVLRRGDFVFLGMIGSQTKAARFRSQLTRRLSVEQAERLVCPIGLANARSKLPAAIAVSVVAQLLPLLDTPPTQAPKAARWQFRG
jgi:xanthine dehydrogenase accessory factor